MLLTYCQFNLWNDTSNNSLFFLVSTTNIHTGDSRAHTGKALPLIFKTSFLSFSVSPVSLSPPPPPSEMTPPCLPPHPFILVFFSALHLSSAHAPPASIFLFLPHLSSLLRSLLKMTRVVLREGEEKKRRRPSCPRSGLSSSSAPGFLPGVSLLVFI